MATLLLGALGTVLGGPFGGALGALAGRQIDSQIIGSGSREGPRLKDLAITTSSYGTAIPRHYGRMRAAGTIIWATDLVENRETSGGGKGKPKTTSYSYSLSLAVALSSRPILDVRRIWADGNLLRGEAGDLKVGGTFRIHTGRGGQAADPVIAAAEGTRCPAFRNCAYIVFEDLELAEFGNRIPALTFEILADEGTLTLDPFLQPLNIRQTANVPLTDLQGFSHESGAVANTLAAIDALYPIMGDAGGDGLTLLSGLAIEGEHPILPAPITAPEEGEFGPATGRSHDRSVNNRYTPDSLRYYDVARDFQPGIQRADGRARTGSTQMIEFPGALAANDARSLANAAALRAGFVRERLLWRCAELDPAIAPGRLVRAPGITGLWRIDGWEWRDKGIELELARIPSHQLNSPSGDAGAPANAHDEPVGATWLRAFELPWDGSASGDDTALFVSAGSRGGVWNGAALYRVNSGELEWLSATGRTRSTAGTLVGALGPSESVLLDQNATIEVDLFDPAMQLASTSMAGIAGGANRVIINGEVVQFVHAAQLDQTRWRLGGLLRGRGGTELAAQEGHNAGSPITLIDDNLIVLDRSRTDGNHTAVVAAIGRGDDAPVFAPLENAGLTRKPLSPVHPVCSVKSDGSWELCWQRRARGAWGWPDEVDAPLVEQSERYRIGIGPVLAPVASWESATNALTIDCALLVSLAASFPGATIWVRQIGSHAQSDSLRLTNLP